MVFPKKLVVPPTRSTAMPSSTKATMTINPTFNSDHAIDFLCAMGLVLHQKLCEKPLDIGILGSPQYFVRTFKDNLSFAQEQEARICNAQILTLPVKGHVAVSIDRV